MTQKPPKPAKKAAPPLKPGKGAPVAPLPNNPLVMMGRMIKEMIGGSLGKLPAPLVIILTVSALAMVLTGLGLKLAEGSKPVVSPLERFLPLRLIPDQGMPVLTPAAVEGIWVSPKGTVSMTLQLRNGLFEWIIQQPGSDYMRQFVRGAYRIEGNVLILAQRPDMGKPSTNGQIMDYMPIAMKNLNTKVEFKNNLMLWRVPQTELDRFNAEVAALFPPGDSAPMSWIKAKSP